jgi:hypothetical protein
VSAVPGLEALNSADATLAVRLSADIDTWLHDQAERLGVPVKLLVALALVLWLAREAKAP